MTVPELVPSNASLVVEVGSTAHGTGLPGHEDLDITAIVLETPGEVLGLAGPPGTRFLRTKPEGVPSDPGDVDVTVYTLRKFLSLAAAGNPSVMLALWAPVLESDRIGDNLRRIAPAFVGRHVIPRYRGYMKAQAERLLGLRGGRGPRDGQPNGWDTKYAMHCARLGIQCIQLMEQGKVPLPVPGADGEWLRSLRAGGVPFEEWWDMVLFLDERLGRLRDDAAIPPGPDTARIDGFSISAHLVTWDRPW